MRGGPPVSNYELNRWARRMVREHSLKPREAHVLLILATYANPERLAWPSVRTIALDCGLTPVQLKDPRRDNAHSWSNSSVSAALRRLEDLGLIWTRKGGHGKPSERELLYTQPSATQDGNGTAAGASHPHQPSATPDGLPSATQETKNQRNKPASTNQTAEETQSHPATRMATPPALGMAEAEQVKAAIRESLRSAA